MIIEKAKQEDRDHIFRLLKQANMHYIPSEEMPCLTYENYFVARLNGEITGFCGYKIVSKKKAKTELMVVDLKYRGKGIGYKLQEKRMEEIYGRGISTLVTNSDLPDTINWYIKKFGYREIGKLKKLHEFGDPKISHWTTLEVDLVKWFKKRSKI